MDLITDPITNPAYNWYPGNIFNTTDSTNAHNAHNAQHKHMQYNSELFLSGIYLIILCVIIFIFNKFFKL